MYILLKCKLTKSNYNFFLSSLLGGVGGVCCEVGISLLAGVVKFLMLLCPILCCFFLGLSLALTLFDPDLPFFLFDCPFGFFSESFTLFLLLFCSIFSLHSSSFCFSCLSSISTSVISVCSSLVLHPCFLCVHLLVSFHHQILYHP